MSSRGARGAASGKAAVAASDARVVDAALSMLPRGSAVDAVVAGIFLAAAHGPSVLLGPVQLLIGGPGMGLRAIDGRTRQPGRGVPRPRGFVEDAPIPDAARVAVPVLPAAMAVALAATASDISWSRLLAPAVAAAKGASAKARAAVLLEIAHKGARAFASPAIAEELVGVAGRLAGGLLTLEDLKESSAAVEACALQESDDGTRRAAHAPWGLGDGSEEHHQAVVDRGGGGASEVRVIAAVDARGRVAIACYEVAEQGVEVPALECVAPLTAEPVRRGQPRVVPGSARAARAPITLLETDGALEMAFGYGGRKGDKALAKSVASFLRGAPVAAPTGVNARASDAIVGVVRTRAGARAL